MDISFRVKSIEPLGISRFWMAWEQYDPDVNCVTTDTCLTTERVTVRDTPFRYLHTEKFTDAISRPFIVVCLWIIAGAGLFGLLGAPVNVIVYLMMNIYVQFTTFLSFFKFIESANGGFFDETTKFYTFQNWVLEMVMFWSGGTLISTSYLLALVSFVPVLGPLFGVVLILAITPILTF